MGMRGEGAPRTFTPGGTVTMPVTALGLTESLTSISRSSSSNSGSAGL
jgi:hypothetical protein